MLTVNSNHGNDKEVDAFLRCVFQCNLTQGRPRSIETPSFLEKEVFDCSRILLLDAQFHELKTMHGALIMHFKLTAPARILPIFVREIFSICPVLFGRGYAGFSAFFEELSNDLIVKTIGKDFFFSDIGKLNYKAIEYVVFIPNLISTD